MTSTEFTIGLSDDVRASSKVLKPPGGGSSDIFGTQSSHSYPASRQNGDTQSRLFGGAEQQLPVGNKVDHMKSNIFGAPDESPRSAKKYVQRNPITGEVSEIEKIEANNSADENEVPPEPTTTEVSGNGKIEANNGADENEAADVVKGGTCAQPVPPARTFVRVRNPPGGKSSGIF